MSARSKKPKNRRGKKKKGNAWRATGPKREEEEEEEEVPLHEGPSPVFASAQSQLGSGAREKAVRPKVEWDNPAPNVLERARAAAEEGWDERRWEEMSESADLEDYRTLLPAPFLERRREVEVPTTITEHVEKHQLGIRRLRKWPKGEHRPVIFSGSDPMHNGMRDSIDDGKGSSLDRMAVAVGKGFMRHRASSHPTGSLNRRGDFPLAERPELAFIGSSNVGKSSLLNALTRTQKLAEAKDVPGVTRSINWYKCSRLPIDVIDLPGYGFAQGADFAPQLADFVATRKALRMLYVLIDARTGFKPTDWEWLQLIGNMGPKKVFILTKCDLVSPKELGKSATIVLQDLQHVPRSSQRLLMVSARSGHGMHDLRYHLCSRALHLAKQVQQRLERAKEKQDAGRQELTAA